MAGADDADAPPRRTSTATPGGTDGTRASNAADADVAQPSDTGVVDPDSRPSSPLPRVPVAVIGAGPVGLTLAIDLARRGIPVVVLDPDPALSTGSRAICFAKRTLEVFDRLGCGERIADAGVSWNVGKVFFGDAEVYRFDLLAEPGHERPAFVNLPQHDVERALVDRAAELPLIDLRWRHGVVGLALRDDGVTLEIDGPDGRYALDADWAAACDGSRSPTRERLGLARRGRAFRDRFLIADVRMRIDLPAERWFWFDPSFHRQQSALLHRQPDGVWRIDFQLGWDADPDLEKQPERIVPRVEALLAAAGLAGAPFELVWASVYSFACTRIEHFRHGRVVFAGDAAHGVSPFGARGANSGIQDADNLGWKLAAVLRGTAPEALVDSYAQEREFAADENIRHSTRSTDFITPKSEISRLFRDAVLELSRAHPFARTLVNSGRLSTATCHAGSELNTPDSDDDFDAAPCPGSAAVDAPVQRADGSAGWLLRELGDGFTALVYGDAAPDSFEPVARAAPPTVALQVRHIVPCGAAAARGGLVDLLDVDGLVAERYDMLPGTVYLLRPDRHVCARWRRPSAEAVGHAIQRALALTAAVGTRP